MAQAMANDDLPPAQLERLLMIRQSGQALLSLLNDLLDLSKIEAGKTELEDGVIDIGEVADSAKTAFTTLAAAKAIFFVLEVTPTAVGRWRGDVTKVRQILYNLVSNAVKFTTEGSVQVLIDTHDGVLLMRVTDTGPGIPADRMASLFNKFVQVDASTTRKFGGTGLGLAISRHLAELMGGAIKVESAMGEGSIFEARLPLERLGGAIEAAPAAQAPAELLGDLRILAADDNPLNQLVLKTLMAQVGLAPQMVDNGLQAVEAWELGDWDVILMDVQMPEMDGPTASRTIRSREAETGRNRTPIIALTANAMAHQAAEYAAAGMDMLVSKPIDFGRLLEALDQVLSEPAVAAEPALLQPSAATG
jgi:CheY-like chemotaxis protein/anti-sigma regulatory factor (Ser/Thr protein kinase)